MSPELKLFIEKNINNIENNLYKLFFNAWNNYTITSDDVVELCEILDDIGIPKEVVAEGKQQALFEATLTIIGDVLYDKGEPDELPVREFVEIYFDNRLGYSVEEVVDFIGKNADYFDNVCEIFVNKNNILTIRKR